MDTDLKIDSHKLIYHPKRVAEWLNGSNVYPIELEIALSGGCNHRCIFCGCDYLGHKNTHLDKNIIMDTLKISAELGVKSIVYAGEGEPLLNKNASQIINRTRELGMDVGMSSNGVLFTKEFAQEALESLTWVRFSIAAMTEEKYEFIQKAKKGDLQKLIINLGDAVKIKKERKLRTTLGAQLILLPDNVDEVMHMAKMIKEIGLDYFTVKPYSHQLRSENKIEIEYNQDLLALEKELEALETDTYKIYFRANSMKKIKKGKSYDHCLGLPFIIYIDSKGNIWPCCDFVGVEGFSYGNIYKQNFKEIWESQQRKKVMQYFLENDVRKICKETCRIDELNKYLYELKNPHGHVNFI